MKNKIYDCFLFNNELELLELRVSLLNPYVDHFLLVESPYTFPGKKKELVFEKNKHLFDTSKIIHIIYEKPPFPGNVNGERSKGKANEYASRNYMRVSLKRSGAQPEDIIMISDIDEIPNMEVVIPELYKLEDENLHLLKHKSRPQLGTSMKLFYYYMNYLTDYRWSGTAICKNKNFKVPNRVRNRRFSHKIKNGGWHYSYLGGIDRIKTKISRLGSTQMKDKADVFNDNHLRKCLEDKKDIYNRNLKIKIVNVKKHGPENIIDFVKKYPQFIKGAI